MCHLVRAQQIEVWAPYLDFRRIWIILVWQFLFQFRTKIKIQLQMLRIWRRDETNSGLIDFGSVTRRSFTFSNLRSVQRRFFILTILGPWGDYLLYWRFWVGDETIFYFDDSGSMTRLSYTLASLKRLRFFNYFLLILLFFDSWASRRLFIWANFRGYG